jgi:hypothetical protein
MMRIILAAVLASAAASSAVAAPAPLLTRWDTAAVRASLVQAGAADIRVDDLDGLPMITARTRDGLAVGVYAKACDPSTAATPAVCHGLETIVSFDPGAAIDRGRMIEHLNMAYASGKFMSDPAGTIRLSRYVSFDGGVTPDHLRAELASYFTLAGLTARTLWPAAAPR